MHQRIAIIGAGFSGLGLAIRLRRAGHGSFAIFEKAERLGGTWRENTYPGAACDSPSFAYCYSFEQKTDWSRKWSPQEEILGYIEQCAEKHRLLPQIRFGCEIASASFDAEAALWRLRTTGGEEHTAQVLVSAVGQLNRPAVPDLPGLADFAGACFHSAQWDHDVDLAGKRVAVIGNAASAIQLVPEVAKRAAKLVVFQRSANWMLTRNDRAYSEAEKRRFTRHPWLARLYRWWIWASFEARFPLFKRNRFLRGRIEKLATDDMRKQISDPALQQALIPDYPVGGKRILVSDDYYAALERENVEVVTKGIDHFRADAAVGGDGSVHPVDVVILATGFETTTFLAPMELEGLEGRKLRDEWREGARAYLGLTVAGFPNFFMMYGPNTNLGHNSIIFMLECQIRYIVACIERLRERDLAWLDLRDEVMEAYNERLQRELAGTVWADTDHSWYKDEAGRITNNWSSSTIRYWWQTRKPDFGLYREVARAQ